MKPVFSHVEDREQLEPRLVAQLRLDNEVDRLLVDEEVAQVSAAASLSSIAGALAWAGLANLYYWIDRANGIGGFWATQIFPFADPTSVGGYLDFETAVYNSLAARKAA